MTLASNEQLQQQLEYTLLKPDCHSWSVSKMQSGRQDTLEERYAIKFCFKLGKMPQKRLEWHFHQDNAPVHNSILVTDYLTKMRIKTVLHPLYNPDLSPCDFCLFPNLRGYRYETIEEMKEAVTKVIDKLTQEDFQRGLPEVVGKVQQVHCSRRRLLRRGLEFHVRTINKSGHTKKVWKLI